MKDSARFIRRHMNKALRRSYLKALTEPITNSDDSYRRLEKDSTGKQDKPKSIIVFADGKRDQFDVLDHAEGIFHEEMIDSFTEYGEEKRTHSLGGRGVFGQGLSDVLFSREQGGWIHSIKNGSYTAAQFKWKKKKEEGVLRERRVIRVPESRHVDKAIRQQLDIPAGNGTRVCFKFKEARFPTGEELLQRLSQFYMLRLINSNPGREVFVQYLDQNGNGHTQAIRYDFPQGVLLGRLSRSMTYDGVDISIQGELYRCDNPLPQADAGEDRQGGLLVYDEEHSVLDLSLFGYDNDPLAIRFWGKLCLDGAHQLIRKKLKEQDEIVTETRDGFVRTHSFYVKIKEIVDEWLRPFVEAERSRVVQQESALTDETHREHKKAFEMLNGLYKKVNSEIIPIGPGTTTEGEGERPENGIQFSSETATLRKGTKYSVQLRIDSRTIHPGTRIRVRSRHPAVKLRPKLFEVAPGAILPEDEIDRRRIVLWSDNAGLETKILAKTDGRRAELAVSVVEQKREEETPKVPELKDPLEFHPSLISRKPGASGNLHLLVDIERVPKTGTITLACSNERILLQGKEVTSDAGIQLSEKVSKVDLSFICHSEGQTGTVTAKYGDARAEAMIRITSFEGFGDLFRDWDYREVLMTIQAYFEPETGLVVLNSRHPVNQQYFGTDKLEAHRAVESLPQSQMLLATLILDVCLWFTYSEAYKNNRIELRDPKNPWISIQRYIEESKFELGRDILSKFIRRAGAA